MKRKRKQARRRSPRHLTAYTNGIVTGPLRLAIEALIEVKRDGGWRLPGLRETIARLANGRAVHVRQWATGHRRAPAWFVAVLREQLLQRRAKLDAVLADLEQYKPVDRAERSRKLAAKARAEMAAGIGAIGQRLARKRKEALEREQRLRAIYPPQGENNAPASAGLANMAEKSTPTIDR